QDSNDEHRITKILYQKLRRDDVEHRQNENHHRQFEYDAESDEHDQNQIEIFIDADQGLHGPCGPHADQETQHGWQHDEIAKSDSRQEQNHRGDDESGHSASFVFVKSRRYKLPDLINHPGHRNHDSEIQT